MKLRAACVFAAAILLAGCFHTLDWREYQSAEGGYAVTFPGKVQHQERTIPTSAGAISMQMDSASAGNALFGVGYADYPADSITTDHAQKLYAEVGRALARNIGAATPALNPASLGKLAAVSLHAEGGNADRRLVLDARLAFAGKRLYQVVVIHEAADHTVDKDALEIYFSSFRVDVKTG